MNIWHNRQTARLLITDYLRRTQLFWGFFGLVCFVLAALWFAAEGRFATVKCIFAFYLVALCLITGMRSISAPSSQILRMLPLSRNDRWLAGFVQVFAFPLLVATAAATVAAVTAGPFLLADLLGRPLSSLPESWLLWVAVSVFSSAAGMLNLHTAMRVLHSGSVPIQRHRGLLLICSLLVFFVLGESIVIGSMLLLSPIAASFALVFAAAVVGCACRLFWPHVEQGMLSVRAVDWAVVSDAPPEFAAVRRRGRLIPFARQVKMGFGWGVLISLTVVMDFHRKVPHPGMLFVFPMVLSAVGIALWMPSFRALRMLPLQLGQVARFVTGIQLAITLPSVLCAGVVAALAAAYTGETWRACMVAGFMLGGEAVALLMLPVCLKYWEVMLTLLFLVLVLGSGYVDDVFRHTVGFSGVTMVILVVLPTVAVALSYVVCLRAVESFLVTDTRAYIGRAVRFFGKEL